jgi:simple sugar transport system permease protein
MLRLEPRPARSRLLSWLSPLIAILLTLVFGGILFTAMGFEPFSMLGAYFIDPISSVRGLGGLAVKATPLILIAIGLAVGFRANVWNIGAEGQLVMGGIVGGGVALMFHDDPFPLLLPAMLVAGVLGGMAWAAIPALLKTRFNASEILTSLMLTYVASLLYTYLVYGPWRDPHGNNFPGSERFSPEAILPFLSRDARIHIGAIFALLAVAGGWVLISRALAGYRLGVVGLAPRAARHAGFSRKGAVWLSMLLSGGLAGLAGIIEVAGPLRHLPQDFSPGYGFTAIIVAFLGRLHPAGILFGGLVMALSFVGGEAAQISVGMPKAVTSLFQGVLLFFLLACDVLIHYRLRLDRRRAERPA